MKKLNVILIADNDSLRTKGLMFHKPLKLDECAFFVFPTAGKHQFWNANVDFPISLIFCNKDKEIKDIKYLNANQLKSVTPEDYNITYVIEGHKNLPESLKLKIGDKINFSRNEVIFNVGNS